MDNIALLPAKLKDVGFIVNLVKETYQEQLIKTYGHFDIQKQTEWWEENLNPNFHQIIEFKGQKVGLYGVSRTDTEINLELMFLMPEFQGKSIASTLLAQLIDESRETGKQLITRCLKCHDSAKNYWLKKGFVVQKTDEKRIYFQLSI